MLPSRLALPVIAAALVGAALPSHADEAGASTFTYQGASRVMAPDTYGRFFLTDSPGTLTGFRVTTGKSESRLRVRVADVTGLPVAVTVSWGDEEQVFCDAADVRSRAVPADTALYVEVLAGACDDGSSARSVSAPTQGTITLELG